MIDFNDIKSKILQIQRSSGHRYVVYTCVTNSYSEVIEVPYQLRGGMDFILFTDNSHGVDGWHVIRIPDSDYNPRRSAKIYKILPHEFFSSYSISIWIDGNIKISSNLLPMIARFDSEIHDMILYRHNKRSCLYQEAKECLKWGKDDAGIIYKQITEYKTLGYPLNNGLYWGGFLIRKHNNIECKRLMIKWWDQISRYSLRDQISLPYVLNSTKINVLCFDYSEVVNILNVCPHNKYQSYVKIGFNQRFIRSLIAKFIYMFFVVLRRK